MVAQFGDAFVSGPVPKGSDVDVSVSLPAKEAKVARKADRASREVLDRRRYGYTAFEKTVDSVSLGVLVADCVLTPSATTTVGMFGGIYGGTTGAVLGSLLPAVSGVGIACGALSCVLCSTKGAREVTKELFPAPCRCVERCVGVKRPREETKLEPEEVITEQPRPEPPSPEPAATGSAWWGLLGGFVAEPTGTIGSVDASSV
ncbi:MAG: hypothetical protein OXF02_01235 [Simkaniaceae bacterium]|nr:hypothetical protein [Simkaniaceae bacterium]